MKKLNIYGELQTRALGVLWLAEELGVDYCHLQKNEPDIDYVALNPAGNVPTIDDDGTIASAFDNASQLTEGPGFHRGYWQRAYGEALPTPGSLVA